MAFFSISYTKKGTNPTVLLDRIENRFYNQIKERLIELSNNTVKSMRFHISSSKKRPSLGSNLEDNIEAEILQNIGKTLEIGIGNITQLKANAPYYEVLDVGGYVPYSTKKGAPLGSFAPGEPKPNATHFREGNWERSGEKGFFMKPKKAIEGIDYVGKVEREFRVLIERDLSAWIRTQIDNISKG